MRVKPPLLAYCVPPYSSVAYWVPFNNKNNQFYISILLHIEDKNDTLIFANISFDVFTC